MQNETEIEYSLSEIFEILFKRIWLILLCLIIGTVGTFTITKFVLNEEYTASVSMYVAPNKDNADIIASLNELNYAQEVVNTYIEILKTNAFLKSVVQTSNLEYTVPQLKNMVEMSAVNGTEIFEVKVTTNDPQDSLKLANTIARLAPQKIIEIKDADAVRVVDPAVLPKVPSAPNVLMNTAIGFAVGLMAGVMIAFVLEMMDKRVKDEDDIIKHYNVPVLGMVPLMDDK